MEGYGSYSFCLEWHELPDELREEKIDAYIEANGGTGYDLQNQEEREEAEASISARFPIYF